MSLHWASEIFTQHQENPFQRLNYRKLIGAGARLTVLNTPTEAIYTGIGSFRAKEKNDLGTTEGIERYWSANLYLVYKRELNENVRFLNTFYEFLSLA